MNDSYDILGLVLLNHMGAKVSCSSKLGIYPDKKLGAATISWNTIVESHVAFDKNKSLPKTIRTQEECAVATSL